MKGWSAKNLTQGSHLATRHLGKAQRDLIKHTQKLTGLTGSKVIRPCIDLGALHGYRMIGEILLQHGYVQDKQQLAQKCCSFCVTQTASLLNRRLADCTATDETDALGHTRISPNIEPGRPRVFEGLLPFVALAECQSAIRQVANQRYTRGLGALAESGGDENAGRGGAGSCASGLPVAGGAGAQVVCLRIIHEHFGLGIDPQGAAEDPGQSGRMTRDMRAAHDGLVAARPAARPHRVEEVLRVRSDLQTAGPLLLFEGID